MSSRTSHVGNFSQEFRLVKKPLESSFGNSREKTQHCPSRLPVYARARARFNSLDSNLRRHYGQQQQRRRRRHFSCYRPPIDVDLSSLSHGRRPRLKQGRRRRDVIESRTSRRPVALLSLTTIRSVRELVSPESPFYTAFVHLVGRVLLATISIIATQWTRPPAAGN